jgi:CubicO group peptidase (beta-lactamase class C family)
MGITAVVGAAMAAALVQVPAGPEAAPIEERLEQALQAMVPPVAVAGRTYRPRPVTELMGSENVPGISVAVVEDGRIVWARGFGVADRATGSAVTPETLFQAASISKPVAASGALALVDAGVLSLDRPVNEQLASWQVPAHAFAQQVTLRRLLSHNAGLTVHGFPGYRTDAALPTVV